MEEILKRLEKLKLGGSSWEYNDVLLDLIPYLKRFQFVEGGEGKAYFIPHGYVVKEYSKVVENDLFDKYFEAYAREIRGFAKHGLNVPNIYAWNKIPQVIIKKNFPKIQYSYYILEERVKGRPIFSGPIEDIFHLCTDLCDEKRFNSVVANPYLDGVLYNEIAKHFVDDYIVMNQSIESLSENEIEKFVMSVYNMFENGEYSSPDMYPSNVLLLPEKQLYIIDNHLISKSEDEYYNSNSPEGLTLSGLLFLFLYNELVTDIKNVPYFALEGADFDLRGKIKQNSNACDAAIRKIMKVTKKCIYKPVVINKNILLRLHSMLKHILGKDKANEIIDFMYK